MAGHGAGKPADEIIEETVNMQAFAASWTGLNDHNINDKGLKCMEPGAIQVRGQRYF